MLKSYSMVRSWGLSREDTRQDYARLGRARNAGKGVGMGLAPVITDSSQRRATAGFPKVVRSLNGTMPGSGRPRPGL